MTLIAQDQTPFLPRGVRLHRCEIRGGWYLLAPERAVKMNDIGVAILGAVDGQRTLAGVIEKLAKDFNAPEERIAKDAGRFLEDLIGRRMVEVKG